MPRPVPPTLPHRLSRRMALLGAAGTLSGCSTIEGWFFPPRVKLQGERDAVLAGETLLQPDDGLEAEQVILPPPDPQADWPQAGGGPTHLQEHPAAGDRLTVAWSTSLGSGSSTRQRILAQPIVAPGTGCASHQVKQTLLPLILRTIALSLVGRRLASALLRIETSPHPTQRLAPVPGIGR